MSLILENSQALSLQMLFLHQFSLLSVWDFTYIYVRPSQCTACLYFYILLIFDSPCFILNFFSDLFFNTFLHSSALSNLLLIPHTEFLFVGCGIFLYLEFPFGYFLWFLVICWSSGAIQIVAQCIHEEVDSFALGLALESLKELPEPIVTWTVPYERSLLIYKELLSLWMAVQKRTDSILFKRLPLWFKK